jgi:hypothetical protein
MKASTDRILTTHTGSLHRQPELEEIFRKKLAGERYDEAEFERSLRDGVARRLGNHLGEQLFLAVEVIENVPLA